MVEFKNFDSGNSRRDEARVDVYQLVDNLWEPLGSPWFASAVGDEFGAALDLNEDGTVLVVGTPRSGDTGEKAGKVQVFRLVNDNWEELGNALTGSVGSEFGHSVTITPNGDQLVVGAPKSSVTGDETGEAFYYRLAGV